MWLMVENLPATIVIWRSSSSGEPSERSTVATWVPAYWRTASSPTCGRLRVAGDLGGRPEQVDRLLQRDPVRDVLEERERARAPGRPSRPGSASSPATRTRPTMPAVSVQARSRPCRAPGSPIRTGIGRLRRSLESARYGPPNHAQTDANWGASGGRAGRGGAVFAGGFAGPFAGRAAQARCLSIFVDHERRSEIFLARALDAWVRARIARRASIAGAREPTQASGTLLVGIRRPRSTRRSLGSPLVSTACHADPTAGVGLGDGAIGTGVGTDGCTVSIPASTWWGTTERRPWRRRWRRSRVRSPCRPQPPIGRGALGAVGFPRRRR